MILSGRAVDGPRAFKLKLADALYPAEFMAEKTGEFLDSLLSPSGRKKILKKRRRRCSSGALFGENPLARAVIFAAAKKQVLKKTGGHYAAPLTALKVVRRTCRGGERRALQAESRAFAGLAVSDVAKNLISLFFTGEALKKEYAPDPKKKSPPPKPLSAGAVLGAGTMGGGIAWLFSNAGVPVVMKDIYQQAVANAYAAVHSIYNDLVRLGRLERRLADLKAQKVSGRTDFRGFDRADFIVEAIVEDRTIKLKALAGLEAYCRPDAVIGTNTSSLSVNELARALKHPERFIGFHFFNPVNRMYLVEVVPGAETSPDTLARAVGYARELGKTPIVVGDCHGFLVNRVLMAYLNEALLLLEEGYDFTLVDRLAVGFGMPMGPFALLDEIGIGVAFKVAHILASAYKGRMETGRLASAIEAEKTLSGRQGGKGFYLYAKKSRRPNPRIAGILKSQGIGPARGRDKDEILKRMLLRMVNEAALCLEEGIIQKAEYLDLAMIYGTGFPPFRGGILRYADSLDIGTVISLMKRFEEQAGGRFTPGALLKEMEKKKRGFYS
jgi:3-hydroxyacyl-CoA dehydrogenase/enoyl-CoA hydratase/3-hydroxybutyryl-CoA epimerase